MPSNLLSSTRRTILLALATGTTVAAIGVWLWIALEARREARLSGLADSLGTGPFPLLPTTTLVAGVVLAAVLSLAVFWGLRARRRESRLVEVNESLRREIEARDRAEAALGASRERLEELYDSIHDVLYTMAPDGTLTSLNRAFERETGWTREEWVGRSFEELVHPADVEKAVRSFRSALEGREERLFQLRIRTRGGDYLVGEFTTVPQRQDGRIVGILGSGRNITGRLQVERRLAETYEVVRALVRSSPLAICAQSVDGIVTLWNPAAEELFGWTAEEIVGEPYPGVPPDEREASRNLRVRVLEGEVVRGTRTERLCKDGSRVAVDLSLAPLWSGDGDTITGLVAFAEDASRKRELERRLQQAQKLEALGRVTGGIAHDFGNVLTAVKGCGDLLTREIDRDAEVYGDVEEMLAIVESGQSLVRQLLTFSREEAQELELLELGEILEGSERLLRRFVGEGVEVETRIGSDAAWIEADRGQIEQILLNLSVNAGEAMPEGGSLCMELDRIRVEEDEVAAAGVDAPGPFVRLVARDTGEGMAASVAARAFDPFFTTKSEGTGLGMSTVYGIVEGMGGTVRIDSDPGEGTAITVLLPEALDRPVPAAGEETEERRQEPSPVGSGTPGAAGAGDTERRPQPTAAGDGSEAAVILLLEDEEGDRELTRKILESHGYTVREARDGEEAVEVAREDPRIDLLVADIVLPGRSGPDVAEQLARRYPELRVMFMSGYSERALTRYGVDQETDVLQKPFAASRLLEYIRRVLEEEPATAST